MVASARVIEKIMSDFSHSKGFIRLAELMALKTECQQIISEKRFLEKSMSQVLENALIEEAEILTRFTDEYVPNVRKLVKKVVKRKVSAAEKELMGNLKTLLKLFIKYNKKGLIWKASVFLDVNQRQLHALKIGRFGSFSRLVDEQKDLELELYRELKKAGCEEKFEEYFKDISTKKRFDRRKFMYLLAFAGLGALAALHESKYRTIQNLAARYFGGDISEELKKIKAILGKFPEMKLKQYEEEGARYLVVHIRQIHAVDWMYIGKVRHYDFFELFKKDFIEVGMFQKGLYNVLSALAKEGYADVHAEGNTKKMSAAESKEHLEQYKDYLNVIIKMFEAFKKAYLDYLAHYNLLRKKFKEYKANKTPEKKEALKLLHSRLENLRSILLKFIPKIKSTKITAESSEKELRNEAVKIIENLEEIKDFMKKNNELLYYYSGAAMRLAFEGKIRRIPCEDAKLLKELEASVLSGNQREVARIHVGRELFALNVMVRDMDSSGKRVAIIVFGGSHSWKKYVDFLNKKYPNGKIALLEATPKGFEEYMKKTKETQKKLDKAIKKMEEASKLADEALEKARKIPKIEKSDIDRALELEMKNQ